MRVVVSLLMIAVVGTGCVRYNYAPELGPGRPAMWIDMYEGEPVAETDLIDDLATADVIYLGERHTVDRHHGLQWWVIDQLGQRGVELAVAMEMLEADMQPEIDRFNSHELGFEELAEAIDWGATWKNYEDYKEILGAARRLKAPVIALNARTELIRDVARKGGVDGLEPAERAQLPEEVWLDDPEYEALLNIQMGVHASASPEMMRPMMEAQMARDAMMASRIVEQLRREPGRKVVVLCGAGHVNYGMGTVARVRRAMPEVRDRIVVLSESGDVELSPQMAAMAQEIEYTHDDLRPIAGPLADYAHVTARKP